MDIWIQKSFSSLQQAYCYLFGPFSTKWWSYFMLICHHGRLLTDEAATEADT